MPNPFFDNHITITLDYSQWMFLFGMLRACNLQDEPLVQKLAKDVHQSVGRLQLENRHGA